MGNRKGSKRSPYNHHQPPRKCRFPGCNNVFKPMNSNQHYCSSKHFSICEICGNSFEVKNLSMIPRACSPRCGRTLREQTMLERYGVRHALQSSKFVDKCKQTNLKHRGVEFPTQCQTVLDKCKQTSMKHYGVEHPMHSKIVVDKLSNTFQHKYGVNYACQLPQCRNGYSNDSAPNRYLAGLLSYLNIDFELEYPIKKFVYDAHVRNTNVLIEINPTITHNVHMSPWNTPVDIDYHRRKFQNARDSGFICINLFDWDNVDVILGKCLWYKYFQIEDFGQPVLHWYNEKSKDHIIDESNTCNYETMISKNYLPVYDSGYKVEFVNERS